MSADCSFDGFPINRRHVVCGGGAATFSAMIATLLGGAKPVRAEPISGAVPDVDGLAVRVAIHSYQFAVAQPKVRLGRNSRLRLGYQRGQAAWADADQRVRPIDACRIPG